MLPEVRRTELESLRRYDGRSGCGHGSGRGFQVLEQLSEPSLGRVVVLQTHVEGVISELVRQTLPQSFTRTERVVTLKVDINHHDTTPKHAMRKDLIRYAVSKHYTVDCQRV
jgi:hypothetical protein